MLFSGALMRFRFGQVLTRTKAALSGFRLVRNLSETHDRPAEQHYLHGFDLNRDWSGDVRIRKIPHV